MRYFNLTIGQRRVVLVAAAMLVVQALLGSFVLGAAASSPPLDLFGNPLCITSTDRTGADGERGDHGAMPECCTAACSMFAPAATDARAPLSLYNPLEPAARERGFAFENIGRIFALERGPGNPRAPPRISA